MNENYIVYSIVPVAVILTAVAALLARGELETLLNESRKRFQEEYAANAVELDVHEKQAPPAWIAAQTLLQRYIATNSFQVRIIFLFSLLAMLVGFGITCYGAMSAVSGPHDTSIWLTALPTIAGILTQIIGATFLYLVRITNQSAAAFVSILDRMNTVGMAVCVVRSIPQGHEHDELRARTYAKMARQLLSVSGYVGASDSPEASTDAMKNSASMSGASGIRGSSQAG